MSPAPLLPQVDDLTQPFWDACAAAELRIQACAACGRRRHPPRPMCPWCQSLETRWDLMSGRARVWSFVVPHPPVLPSFMDVAPYNVVVVELDDDPSIRLVGNLLARREGEINEIDPASITIGEPVQVVFQPAAEDIVLPRWVRA